MKIIGEATITELKQLIDGLLETSQPDMNRAFQQQSGSLNIAISAKITPDNGSNSIKAVISFNLSEKYSLDFCSTANEEQLPLDFGSTNKEDDE